MGEVNAAFPAVVGVTPPATASATPGTSTNATSNTRINKDCEWRKLTRAACAAGAPFAGGPRAGARARRLREWRCRRLPAGAVRPQRRGGRRGGPLPGGRRGPAAARAGGRHIVPLAPVAQRSNGVSSQAKRVVKWKGFSSGAALPKAKAPPGRARPASYRPTRY